MRKFLSLILVILLLLAGCGKQTPQTTVISTQSTFPPEPIPETVPGETAAPTTAVTLPPIVLDLSPEDQEQLLKIGMAELGHTECIDCVALVMCTVLNRVEDGRFGRSVYNVLHARDQFTPVMDGTYEKAEPNETCHAALDQVLRGWDESQGALYYEFCEGESWHSKNLTLLTEHCNTRFYA